jgi:C4-dicarboxylate transporter DctM subunit
MELAAVYLFLPFVVLLVFGVPIAFSLGLACTFFVAFAGTPVPLSVMITEMAASLDNYALLALPAFVMTGELLNRSGLTDRLIRLATSLVGWIRGGLAHVTTATGMLLGCISGSALADAATLGPLMIPAMVRERYPAAFAASISGAAATIGAILPPSVPLVIIGSQLGISVGGLFVAGIIPGILTGLVLMIAAFIISVSGGYGVVHPFEGVVKAARNTLAAVPILIIPLIILGGILGGVFTPTEAGAVAVFYAIVVGVFYYRSLDARALWQALRATTRVTAGALIIVAISLVFGRILTYQQVPQELLQLVLGMTENRLFLFLILVSFLLVVGTFMDAVANMIILGPLLMPIAVEGLGMHPTQYGIFLMYALLLGVLTPPLGLVLYIVAPIAGVSIERLSLSVLPFLAAMLVVLALIAFVPDMTLMLPRLAGYG